MQTQYFFANFFTFYFHRILPPHPLNKRITARQTTIKPIIVFFLSVFDFVLTESLLPFLLFPSAFSIGCFISLATFFADFAKFTAVSVAFLIVSFTASLSIFPVADSLMAFPADLVCVYCWISHFFNSVRNAADIWACNPSPTIRAKFTICFYFFPAFWTKHIVPPLFFQKTIFIQFQANLHWCLVI